MSPEQVLGVRESIGPRSDVYALGVTLYETLAKQHPWAATTPGEIINRILHEAPVCRFGPAIGAFPRTWRRSSSRRWRRRRPIATPPPARWRRISGGSPSARPCAPAGSGSRRARGAPSSDTGSCPPSCSGWRSRSAARAGSRARASESADAARRFGTRRCAGRGTRRCCAPGRPATTSPCCSTPDRGPTRSSDRPSISRPGGPRRGSAAPSRSDDRRISASRTWAPPGRADWASRSTSSPWRGRASGRARSTRRARPRRRRIGRRPTHRPRPTTSARGCWRAAARSTRRRNATRGRSTAPAKPDSSAARR